MAAQVGNAQLLMAPATRGRSYGTAPNIFRRYRLAPQTPREWPVPGVPLDAVGVGGDVAASPRTARPERVTPDQAHRDHGYPDQLRDHCVDPLGMRCRVRGQLNLPPSKAVLIHNANAGSKNLAVTTAQRWEYSNASFEYKSNDTPKVYR